MDEVAANVPRAPRSDGPRYPLASALIAQEVSILEHRRLQSSRTKPGDVGPLVTSTDVGQEAALKWTLAELAQGRPRTALGFLISKEDELRGKYDYYCERADVTRHPMYSYADDADYLQAKPALDQLQRPQQQGVRVDSQARFQAEARLFKTTRGHAEYEASLLGPQVQEVQTAVFELQGIAIPIPAKR